MFADIIVLEILLECVWILGIGWFLWEVQPCLYTFCSGIHWLADAAAGAVYFSAGSLLQVIVDGLAIFLTAVLLS